MFKLTSHGRKQSPHFRCIVVQLNTYTRCVQAWKVWKKSGILKVGPKFVKSQQLLPIFPKNLEKEIKKSTRKNFSLILVQRSLESHLTNKNCALNCACAFVCVWVRVYIMCEERTLCMFCTCQEQTSDQEWTHLMFAVSFGFSFGLVIFKNPGILPKIMGIACAPSWH